jgi:hypothetical protein
MNPIVLFSGVSATAMATINLLLLSSHPGTAFLSTVPDFGNVTIQSDMYLHHQTLYLSQAAADTDTDAEDDRPDFFDRDQETRETESTELEAASPDFESSDNRVPWQPFIFRDANFSVWLPTNGTMATEERVVSTSLGPIEFELITTYVTPTTYSAAYSQPLDSEQIETPNLIFDAIQDEMLSDTGFDLTDETERFSELVPGASIPVRELVLTNAGERIVLRMGLVGERIYILGANEPLDDGGTIQPTTVQELYFNSFRYSPYY